MLTFGSCVIRDSASSGAPDYTLTWSESLDSQQLLALAPMEAAHQAVRHGIPFKLSSCITKSDLLNFNFQRAFKESLKAGYVVHSFNPNT